MELCCFTCTLHACFCFFLLFHLYGDNWWSLDVGLVFAVYPSLLFHLPCVVWASVLIVQALYVDAGFSLWFLPAHALPAGLLLWLRLLGWWHFSVSLPLCSLLSHYASSRILVYVIVPLLSKREWHAIILEVMLTPTERTAFPWLEGLFWTGRAFGFEHSAQTFSNSSLDRDTQYQCNSALYLFLNNGNYFNTSLPECLSWRSCSYGLAGTGVKKLETGAIP